MVVAIICGVCCFFFFMVIVAAAAQVKENNNNSNGTGNDTNLTTITQHSLEKSDNLTPEQAREVGRALMDEFYSLFIKEKENLEKQREILTNLRTDPIVKRSDELIDKIKEEKSRLLQLIQDDPDDYLTRFKIIQGECTSEPSKNLEYKQFLAECRENDIVEFKTLCLLEEELENWHLQNAELFKKIDYENEIIQEFHDAIDGKQREYPKTRYEKVASRIREIKANKYYKQAEESVTKSVEVYRAHEHYKYQFYVFMDHEICHMGRDGDEIAIWSMDGDFEKILTMDNIEFYEIKRETIKIDYSPNNTTVKGPSFGRMAVNSAIFGTGFAMVNEYAKILESASSNKTPKPQATSESISATIYFRNCELSSLKVIGDSDIENMMKCLPGKQL